MTQILTHPAEASKAVESEPFVIKFKPLTEMTDDQFAKFCALNDDLRIERNAIGEIILVPPTFGPTGSKNARINTRLGNWAERDGTGDYFDSSTGFKLPNGALRSPNASWISNSRLEALSSEQLSGFFAICPDLVIELRSSSDSLAELRAKMQEYMDSGARLGWLIDPISSPKRVHIYRPQAEVAILDEPPEVSGEPELPGFTLNLTRISDTPL